MVYIGRHPLNWGETRTRCEHMRQFLTRELHFVRRFPNKADPYWLFLASQSYAACACAIAPDDPGVWPALSLVKDTSLAIFKQALASKDVEVPLGADLLLRLPACGPNPFANGQTWLQGFYTAVILRDSEALDALVGVPLQALRQSSVRSAESVYAYIELLQACWRRAHDVRPTLLKALKSIVFFPDSVDARYVCSVMVPELSVLTLYTLRKRGPTEQAMQNALATYRAFWLQGKERVRSEGAIAWGLLAIAVWAYDSNFSLDVQSDYLPSMLVRGEHRCETIPSLF